MTLIQIMWIGGCTLCGALAGGAIAWISARLSLSDKGASSRRYLVMAMAGALIGLLSTLWCVQAGFSPLTAAFTALLGWQLLLIAVVDFENYWLPDVLTVPLALTGVLANAVLPQPPAIGWVLAIASALIAFALLWTLAGLYRLIRKRRGMGAGDPILLGAGCAWVGIMDVFQVLLWASVAALVVVAIMKVSGRAIASDSRLPFGTYLAVGIFACWLPL